MTATINDQWQTVQIHGVAGYDGRQVRYRGDLWAPEVRVKDSYDGAEYVAPAGLLRALRIQVLADGYVEREIRHCQSALVDACLASGAIEYVQYEDIENLTVNPDRWTAAQCREWLEDNGVDYETWDAVADNPFKLSRQELATELEALSFEVRDEESQETLAESLFGCIDDGDFGDVESWRDAVRDNAGNQEIYEWWLVSQWLHGELRDAGQPVLDDGQSHWWGRTCTGQSIVLDGVLQQIAAKYAGDFAD